MMSEIPDDIRKTAYELARNSGWSYDEDFKRIASALLAERRHWTPVIEERDLLRQAVVRYCDRSRMGTVEPMSVQQAIDDAFATS
jgi:hypothetical protein